MGTTTSELTLNEIREKGYAALLRELGPVGYVRFLQQFHAGKGDYTAERHQWLDRLTAEQVTAMLEQMRRDAGEEPGAAAKKGK